MAKSPAAILYDSTGTNPVGVVLDGTVYRLQTEQKHKNEDKIVVVNYRKASIDAATTYLMLIDLNNNGGGGPYKHTGSSSVKLAGLHATALKDVIGDKWRTFIGIILSINATEAVVGWVRVGTIGLVDTGSQQEDKTVITFPFVTDFTVSGGDYTKIADSYKETIAAINTGTTHEDVGGNMRAPAVGDMMLKVERTQGSGIFLIHYQLWYYVD